MLKHFTLFTALILTVFAVGCSEYTEVFIDEVNILGTDDDAGLPWIDDIPIDDRDGVIPLGGRDDTIPLAIIEPASESGVTGTATFIQDDNQISLYVEIYNASPGLHGIHIHEFGDCSAPDATSAGGHWNPTDVAHGKWGEGEFHLGDIGNIYVGDDGTGSIELTTDLWETGTGSDFDIIGRSVIIHADADDFTSQPSGNAGARIGCGTIEWTLLHHP